MRRMAMVALAAALMTGYGAAAAHAQQSSSDEPTAAQMAAAFAAMPDVASMNWSQATGGALTAAPYPVYPGSKLGVAADAGDLYMVSMMTPDGGAKVDAFYGKKLAGWSRRELPGGGIAYVPPARANVKGMGAIANGPVVLIEPREKSPRPYSLITFHAKKHGQ